MKDLNRVTLIGRLVRDGELTFMNSGSAKLDFSVAFTTTKKNGNEWVNETNYLNNLSLWGKQAESIKPYMTKGTQIGIEGHLKMDTWDKDGQKKTLLKVVVDEIQLLGGNSRTGETKFVTSSELNATSNNANEFPEDVPF